MESRVDSYTHKKFKKQLSVEVKQPTYHQNDKESKESVRIVEPSEEKRFDATSERITDNNECVPNQSSTNQKIAFVVKCSSSNLPEFSISVEKCVKENLQSSSNSCISYVKSEQLKSVSFDTSFNSPEPNNNPTTVSTSSILENTIPYSKQNYPIPITNNEDISSPNISEDYKNESNENRQQDCINQEEVQPPPDRNSSGKYVCTYCSLVCSKPSVLQKHIRAHTNERPYPCISCGFSFKTRSNLYKHCRSRTHANRVMGNKAQEINNEPHYAGPKSPQREDVGTSTMDIREEKSSQDVKSKPYKPRFHTANQIFESIVIKNIQNENNEDSRHASSDILSHHINEIINKNNSIINSNNDYILKKQRSNDLIMENNVNNNEYPNNQRYNRTDSLNLIEQRNVDEPLNLTNKNRKRCMSEIAEPIPQKSLIKELLLKNLSSSDMQCQYCKMIFQTVTELELHKLRNCKGKSGAKYSRSSSVNVASILTQNKNAFDNIPQLQNTVFPLNSPGPFLGKTRLVESDKSKSFSFEDGLRTLTSSSPSEISPHRHFFGGSPFSLQYDKEKKNPVKLFGGEVKITHTSGETKSFKIDNKDSEKFESDTNFSDYGVKISENRVIKSSLQSGGTVLTNNKAHYSKQDGRTSQDIIRVYENTSVSPSIDMANINKTKFTFDRLVPASDGTIIKSGHPESKQPSNLKSPSPYSNIMDFSQKAVKLLTPNLKQPNLTVSNLQSPAVLKLPINSFPSEENRIINSYNMEMQVDNVPQNLTKNEPNHFVNSKTRKFVPEPLIPPSNNNLYAPMNLLVDGKVVRYVPGMPGPVAAEGDIDIVYNNNPPIESRTPTIKTTPRSPFPFFPDKITPEKHKEPPTPKLEFNKNDRFTKPFKIETLEIKTDLPPRITEIKSPNNKINELKSSPIKTMERKSPSMSITETKKFARPNSLALKPTTACLKQHHGLTPTMFNQILISPDTPRVAKKYEQHFLNGNYFTYLFLKSSTKPVYCTLNKTQPFYVRHFKKLSMYSEWRQQDTKNDRLYVSAYDSRQRAQKYTMAGQKTTNMIVHSSYKFVISELPSSGSDKGDENQKANAILGGYECNEDYTYIRGRGRGRYVCEKCGIRCKKPSMLKKHIRTHSNDRPYTCNHCNFSFKTKGNLTKHMKSKAHTKNSVASSSSSSSTQQSGTQSSESDTDDSGMDSSDESTRQQEHEAAYGLLSLSMKTTQSTCNTQSDMVSTTSLLTSPICSTTTEALMSKEEIDCLTKTNYAKNKILHQTAMVNFSTPKNLTEITTCSSEESKESKHIALFLGKTSGTRPLTYPYSIVLTQDEQPKTNLLDPQPNKPEPKCIKQFHVIQKYIGSQQQASSPIVNEKTAREISTPPPPPPIIRVNEDKFIKNSNNTSIQLREFNQTNNSDLQQNKVPQNHNPPTLKVNDVVVFNESATDLRKRKISPTDPIVKPKIHKNDVNQVMDLSTTNKPNNLIIQSMEPEGSYVTTNNAIEIQPNPAEVYNLNKRIGPITNSPQQQQHYNNTNEEIYKQNEINLNKSNEYNNSSSKNNGTVLVIPPQNEEPAIYNASEQNSNLSEPQKNFEYDNSAMETLADIATKQSKLEKNTLAKSVASEYLKLATKNEFPSDGNRDYYSLNPVNKDLIKEGNKCCTICSKVFNKPSQLRLHMNIHYLERPYRCDTCSVSFRTKGHLQKHARSASHHNKLSSSPALSSSEPRPFKCSDCNIAFRIHGHLAKHLRAKMHIMKLECLAKIPFGLYAELERSNSLLTEINTSDGDQCLESLKTLAKKVFNNDPNKLNKYELTKNIDVDS